MKEQICVICGCKSKDGQIIDGIWHCNNCINDNNFDFDEWMELYKTNPDEFEKRRNVVIQRFIDSSKNKNRLQKIQWRLNMSRRNKNPLKATMDFYYEMLDSFEEMRIALNNFCELKFNTVNDMTDGKKTKVIKFHKNNR